MLGVSYYEINKIQGCKAFRESMKESEKIVKQVLAEIL